MVYGISHPGIEGKIGMASLLPKVLLDEKRLQELLTCLKKHLATYALPFFLRIQNKKHPTTSTMKIQKKRLAEERISNYEKTPLFLLLEGKYQQIDDTLYKKLMQGKIIPGRVS